MRAVSGAKAENSYQQGIALAFGLIDGFERELGRFLLSELGSASRLRIERNLYFLHSMLRERLRHFLPESGALSVMVAPG